MAFGRYIRRAREQRALTITEVARRLDISIAYLSRIERERENPPPDRLMTGLARALDLPPDDVFAAARCQFASTVTPFSRPIVTPLGRQEWAYPRSA